MHSLRLFLPFASALVIAACARASTPQPVPEVAVPPAAPSPIEALRVSAEKALAPEELAVVAPVPHVGPSCTGAPGAGDDCNGESCCLRIDVPAGEFDKRVDAVGTTERVRVGAFALDKYEATVGRIRAWVRAGQPVPADGAVLHDDGTHPPVRWNGAAFAVQRERQLEGWKRYDTWTGGDERRPKNFINWYTAAAFCHYEGGRLPTDAEWMYVTTGGDEARPYPWGAEAPSPELAVYNCTGNGDPSCSLADILAVGSRPKGAGRWGHLDLAGSMFEWTMDGGAADGAPDRVSRGGGFCYIGGVDRRAQTGLRPLVARRDDANTTSHMVGVRCAYDAQF
jgi:formylglycine-generating enzyme required for sulfatase activity